MMEWPRPSDITNLLTVIPDLIREPTANPVAAVVLFGFAVLVVFALVALVFLFVVGSGEDDDDVTDEAAGDSAAQVSVSVPKDVSARTERVPRTRLTERSPWQVLFAVLLGAGLVVALWVVVGSTSSTREVCESCHADNPHAVVVSTDPHATVACSDCHEPGSRAEHLWLTVPERIVHVVAGMVQSPLASGYGAVTSSETCAGCHEGVLGQTVTIEARELLVSHREPLEGGAECIDCHRMAAGAISEYAAGMDPCLRCHDGGTASAACDVCHEGDPAVAARRSAPTAGSFAVRQVDQPECGGCHDQSAEGCDACHGMRLPHTIEFMRYGHAREGALDVWQNGGRACGVCHYAGRRPCSTCHDSMPAHGESWIGEHGRNVSFSFGCGCHETKAYASGRTFCGLCHETRPPGAAP